MAGGGVPECCHHGKRDSRTLTAQNFTGPARIGISAEKSLFLAGRRGGTSTGRW
jgi:hypothetical protein